VIGHKQVPVPDGGINAEKPNSTKEPDALAAIHGAIRQIPHH
jgi:hypothetical protein